MTKEDTKDRVIHITQHMLIKTHLTDQTRIGPNISVRSLRFRCTLINATCPSAVRISSSRSAVPNSACALCGHVRMCVKASERQRGFLIDAFHLMCHIFTHLRDILKQWEHLERRWEFYNVRDFAFNSASDMERWIIICLETVSWFTPVFVVRLTLE